MGKQASMGHSREKSLNNSASGSFQAIFSYISTRGAGVDTSEKSQNRYIDQLKAYFGKKKSSVNDGKEDEKSIRMGIMSRMKEMIMGQFSFPQGVWVTGFVFGDDKDLPPTTRHYLKVTGMSHVTSASGYNVGLVLGISQPIITRFWGRRAAGLILLSTIWAYTWLAGGSASLLRAAIMASLSLVAIRIMSRQVSPIRLLVASFVTLFVFSRELATSLSFQLSASATLGLILFLPWINQGFATLLMGLPQGQGTVAPTRTPLLSRLTGLFTESLITTLAAQAFTIPLLWLHFQEFSLVSFASNTFLLWLTPVITIAGFAGVGLVPLVQVWRLTEGLITPLAWFLWVILEIFSRGLQFFGQYEQFLLKLPSFSWLGVGIWWSVLLVLSWKLSQDKYLYQNRKLREFYAA